MSQVWGELDKRAVRNAKVLTADAVEQAGSGHPGSAISLQPVTYLLYQQHLRFDPTDPNFLGRDRFVLSAGHASLSQYLQLYFAGVGVELSDLKAFRTFGASLAGHPELGRTPGIEVSTGPLGSGVSMGIGMAMAARHDAALYDPQTPIEESIFNHRVYILAGDGCLQEGVTAEAVSLAAVQQLGNVILIYDENKISIDDDTDISFNEDTLSKFAAMGWHTQGVTWVGQDGYTEDVDALHEAITAAEAETDRPSIIALRSIIAWPCPSKQNSASSHGAALGESETRALKEILGYDPDETFHVDEEALAHTRANAAERARTFRSQWDNKYGAWRAASPERAALLDRVLAGELPENIASALPDFSESDSTATRSASGQVINSLADVMPELWGGSADLGDSNKTVIKKVDSFGPTDIATAMWHTSLAGRNIHYGVREHAMGNIMNGIAIDGLTSPFAGTFFVFADYMRPAVRLAALMDIPSTFVWTHDSIGVGEDGPTHQPVEHLAAYRAIPNLAIVRPSDAAETAQAWLEILRRRKPAGLILTRQNVPNPQRGKGSLSTAENLARGGYILSDCTGTPEVIIMASGSEVQYALGAQAQLPEVRIRVVSMPCMEWFDEQDVEYRESVLPACVTRRVSVEAGIAQPWYKYLAGGTPVALTDFGTVGSGAELFEHFGITTAGVVAAVRSELKR
ncbi:MAG: transketolase [Varibaculum sp.]|nr:transketolase [Varibaculum sp.]